ncbi:MAG: hypothetical protein WBW53_12440 [Terriglobales bacterium]
MHFRLGSLTVVKIEADSYHFVLQSELRHIDEIIDRPKLLAMLDRESGLEANDGEPLSGLDVMEAIDALPVNGALDFKVVEKVA